MQSVLNENDVLMRLDAKLAQLIDVVNSLYRRVGDLEKKVDQIPELIERNLDSNDPLNGNSNQVHTAMSSLANSVLHATINTLKQSTLFAMPKKHADSRQNNGYPRSMQSPMINLAIEKAKVPPNQSNIANSIDSSMTQTINDGILLDLHFQWNDGTSRRAPQDWVFPMTTCRIMWEYWYQGSYEPRMGPYRLLKQRDISNPTNRVQMSQARGVMKKLAEIGVAYHFVGSEAELMEMPRYKSMAIFDQAYAMLETPAAERFIMEPLRSDKAGMYTYRHLYELLIKEKHKIGVDIDGNACTQDAPTCAMIPWQFPTTTCKSMWQYWFKGDVEHDIGPFRLLRSRDVDRFGNDRRTRKLLSSARVLMDHLTDLALDHDYVKSIDDFEVMDEDSMFKIFDQVFDILLHNGLASNDGKFNVKKASKYSYTTVYHALVASVQRKRPRDVSLNENETNLPIHDQLP